MNRDLHQLEVKDGHIFLDGMMLKGITDFNLVHEEGRMFPELTLKMDVRTLPRSTTKNTDGREGESSKEVLEKTRKKKLKNSKLSFKKLSRTQLLRAC